MMRQRLLAVLPVPILISSVLLFAGCSENSTQPDDNSPSEDLVLTGQVWKLVAFEDVVQGTEEGLSEWELYTAEFDGDSVFGALGCSDYGGTFQLPGGGNISITDVLSTGGGCFMHSHSADFLAAIEDAESMEIQDRTLRIGYANGTMVLRFSPANFVNELDLDVDGDGETDIEFFFETILPENVLTDVGIDFYGIRALGANKVLGGVGDSGINAAPLLRGMPINNQPVPPFRWKDEVRLAERESSLTHPGFWRGSWAEGISHHVGIALVRDDEPYFGWVQLRLNVDDPAVNVRILDFFVKDEPFISIRAGER